MAHADSAAIYMGAAEAAGVTSALLAQGRDPATPIALCESVSLPQARTLYGCLQDLPALAARLGHGPALILVGEVFRPASGARRAGNAACDCTSAACRNEPGFRAIA